MMRQEAPEEFRENYIRWIQKKVQNGVNKKTAAAKNKGLKICPDCRMQIPVMATVCTYCYHRFSYEAASAQDTVQRVRYRNAKNIDLTKHMTEKDYIEDAAFKKASAAAVGWCIVLIVVSSFLCAWLLLTIQ